MCRALLIDKEEGKLLSWRIDVHVLCEGEEDNWQKLFVAKRIREIYPRDLLRTIEVRETE